MPEIPFKWDAVARKVMERKTTGGLFSIIAVSEGAKAAEGGQSYNRTGDEMYVPRLGGIGHKVGEYIEKATGVETRVTVLGHVQRGGTPSAYDRFLATRMGSAAVRVAAEGRFDRMVALSGGKIVDVSLLEAISTPKRVDVNGDAVMTARGVGISFGDD